MPHFLRSCCLALAIAFTLGGCANLRDANTPLRTIAYAADCAAGVKPDTLLVLLPGSFSTPEEFAQEGFVQAIRQQALAADVVLVDAHAGYYYARTFIDRLRADVVAPALSRGYQHVWLVGISIGGLGAMLYADARPQDLAGIVAIAPYLGTQLVAKDIRNAGGLANWRAPLFPIEDDLDAGLWRWLQKQTSVTPASGKKIPIFLGYGLSDRFGYSAETLGQALPGERVFTAEGGHDWPAWNALWRRLVLEIPIARNAGCLASDRVR